MRKSLDLLDRVVLAAPSERALTVTLGLEESALRKARERGRLSPELAAILADHARLDIADWTMLAVAEGARLPAAAKALRTVISRTAKLV